MYSCYYCNNEVYFDNYHISRKGKKIPLDKETGQPHSCSKNPYNRRKNESNQYRNRTYNKKAMDDLNERLRQAREEAKKKYRRTRTRKDFKDFFERIGRTDMMTKEEKCKKVLGVNNNATDEEIKIAYKKMLLLNHPDRNKEPNAHEKTMEIIEAYKYLEDLKF